MGNVLYVCVILYTILKGRISTLSIQVILYIVCIVFYCVKILFVYCPSTDLNSASLLIYYSILFQGYKSDSSCTPSDIRSFGRLLATNIEETGKNVFR